MRLDEALNLVSTLPTGLTSTSSFVMTSATWVNTNGVVTVADDNIPAHVATNPADAQANPININLERLAAKVRASYLASFDVKATKADGETPATYTYIVDGKEATFSLAINGWQLEKTAVQANTFKKLNATYEGFTWTWNDTAKKRSYWAETAPGTLANLGYDIYDASQFALGSYGVSTDNVAYCYENTTDAANTEFAVYDRANDKATAIVVKGTLSMALDGGVAQPVSFCKWAGNYYLESTLKQMILDSYNSKGNTSYDEVQFVDNTANDNSYKAQVNTGTTDAANWVDVANFGNILRWIDGVTSYYLNIEHQPGLPGVVRNHIYDYTFDGIVGLGFPGNEDTTPEDEETFVAAHLNILNWNVVKNTITLE